MKTKEEILKQLDDIQAELANVRNNVKFTYSQIREGIKYYTGYIDALEWIIKKDKIGKVN